MDELHVMLLAAAESELPVVAGRGDVAAAWHLLYHDRGGAGAPLGLHDELSQLQPGPAAGQTPPSPLMRVNNNKRHNRKNHHIYFY